MVRWKFFIVGKISQSELHGADFFKNEFNNFMNFNVKKHFFFLYILVKNIFFIRYFVGNEKLQT